jgi:hypothetical protein
MTHAEYVVLVRREAAEIAAKFLAGNMQVLEACNHLAAILGEAEVDENDPDFRIFVTISSEIDSLPIGEVRLHWALDALERIEPEIQEAISWATPIAYPACVSIVNRFGA